MQLKITTRAKYKNFNTVIGTLEFSNHKKTLQTIDFKITIDNNHNLEKAFFSKGKFQAECPLKNQDSKITITMPTLLHYLCSLEITKLFKDIAKNRLIIFVYQSNYFKQFTQESHQKLITIGTYHQVQNLNFDKIIYELFDPKQFRAYLENL